MAKEKIPPHKVVKTEGKREIDRSLLAEYDIKDAHDIQEALKDVLSLAIGENERAKFWLHGTVA